MYALLGFCRAMNVCLFVAVSPHVYRTARAETGLCFKGRTCFFFSLSFSTPVGICIRENFPFFVLEIEGKGFRDFFCFSGVHKEGKRRDFFLVRRTRVRPQWTETVVSRGRSEMLNSDRPTRPTSGSSSKRAQVIARPKAHMKLWNESQEVGLEGDRTHHIRAMTYSSNCLQEQLLVPAGTLLVSLCGGT